MALWQYNFLLLPKQGHLDLLPGMHLNKENYCFDSSPFWMYSPIKPSLFGFFAQVLPIGNSWSENIILYGKEDANCIEILTAKDMVIDISVRIDFTTDYEALLTDVAEFCILKGFVILDESLNVLPLSVSEITSVIEQSPQKVKLRHLSDLTKGQ